MKLMVLTLAILMSNAAHARNLCDDVTCKAQQLAIQNAFNEQPGLAPATASAAYNGVCYHDWPGIDPTQPQFVLSVVEGQAGALTLNSVFNFFSSPNPFANLNLAQAKVQLANASCIARPLSVSADGGYQLIKSTSGTIEYWVRSDAKDFYLLGFWNLQSGQVRTWCHLTRNAAQ